MAESVVPLHLDVMWNPNAPFAVLMSSDDGRAVLAMLGRDGDGSVVLCWRGTLFASAGSPNDEAVSGHRLYRKGLRGLLWAGELRDSRLIGSLEKQTRVHPRHNPQRFARLVHHIVLTKENTYEVVADTLTTYEMDASPIDAALRILCDDEADAP